MSQVQAPSSVDDKSAFGLWVYLMTDCILFASLFATFIVLRHGTFGGPSSGDLFSLPFVLTETLVLLTSSFTIGMAVLTVSRGKQRQSLLWVVATLVLGILFVSLEFYEFKELVQAGHDWRQSAFLSAFFTLVGTHGLHIIAGIIWLTVLIVQMLQKGFGGSLPKRLAMLGMFWHFLDIIWIFIFTFVYLLGAAS